ncbi:hypothetical protein C900_02988 [Fulvivirga imtechensis AK7]|uniref:Uncharacterized protein n=1 Tax=Fulvivirga imtechensis AK7 TaxID=1237149 RepID=L8JUF5_9BACT|nr:hypothetical protein C900_02988 [Fulvivirga imtechensis AK7]
MLDGFIDEKILLEAIALLERGVATTLIIRSDNEERLHDDVFLFNKCLIFIKKGGELYLHDHPAQNIAISDYKHALRWSDATEDHITDENQAAGVHQRLRTFQDLLKKSGPFLEDEDDINIHFTITDDIILKGDEVTLSWQVKHASTVIIEGLGEVGATGSKKLRPGADTIFKIGAYNTAQSRLKTVCVKVYDDIHINYDLSFANLRTKQFSSLVKEENYPHVFGVAGGNIVKLNWQVKDSNVVNVLPFGITGGSGEHEFVPVGNMEIIIEAQILHRIFRRRIQLLVFPIPLFTEKLATVKPQHELQLKATDIHDIIAQVKNRQQAYSQSLRVLKEQEIKKYQALVSQIWKITFDKSDNKINLDEVNRSVFERLKRYYSNKPGITEVIDSIKSYYGKS